MKVKNHFDITFKGDLEAWRKRLFELCGRECGSRLICARSGVCAWLTAFVTNSDEIFFFFFFFFSPSVPVMWTWVSQVTQRAGFTASLVSTDFSSWNIYRLGEEGLGLCRRDLIHLWGGGEGLCWNSQTARCLYPETQIHEVYDPLHLQSEKWESGLWETLSGCAKDSSHKSHTRDCSLICSLILYITKIKTLMVTIHGWLQALFNHTRHCLPGNRSGLFFLSPKKKKA